MMEACNKTTFYSPPLFHLGAALKCYQCLDGIGPCKTNVTCSGDTDSCILVNLGKYAALSESCVTCD